MVFGHWDEAMADSLRGASCLGEDSHAVSGGTLRRQQWCASGSSKLAVNTYLSTADSSGRPVLAHGWPRLKDCVRPPFREGCSASYIPPLADWYRNRDRGRGDARFLRQTPRLEGRAAPDDHMIAGRYLAGRPPVRPEAPLRSSFGARRQPRRNRDDRATTTQRQTVLAGERPASTEIRLDQAASGQSPATAAPATQDSQVFAGYRTLPFVPPSHRRLFVTAGIARVHDA